MLQERKQYYRVVITVGSDNTNTERNKELRLTFESSLKEAGESMSERHRLSKNNAYLRHIHIINIYIYIYILIYTCVLARW